MTLEEIYALYRQNPQVETDTRKLKPGSLFFALKGPNFNGNAFVQQALDAGAAYCIIDEEAYAVAGKTVVVPDVLESLQQLAKYHRQQFAIPFLAITGSNGKTTTKELIHAVLSSTYKTYTTEGNLNNHIGVPLTLLKIKTDARLAIIEMGANHQREIAAYCEIAQPTHGLITNCGKAHLEGFGGEEGVRKGKGELFDYLRTHNGAAFIMQDYEYLFQMSRGITSLFTYGTLNGSVTGTVLQSDPFLKVGFSAGFDGAIQTRLVGSYNLPNVLAAVAVGTYFKVPEKSIQQALEGYVPSNSRSQLMERDTNKIILDAYNANPSSMKLAIENFAHTIGENKILVLGAMAELGTESLQEHQNIIDEIRKYNWKEVVLVGGDFTKLDHPYRQFKTAAEAGNALQETKDAFLLIKGSRSTGMEAVLNYL
ncbi:MAG: UDP-N-acetylmuramoylalanyl-D-glutamate--2,6-diaminopimelate ligase [Flaviaesturariibacter sp.]|nr:UDP-N-acetylmuramoylalanyl-D-glutamate--2,6-diaminopimelate ligase [Flaviaesturariibacter sp.]